MGVNMAGGYEDIFNKGAESPEGQDDFSSMFEGGEDMGEDDGLMRSLVDMGYDVSPEKLDQIKAILEAPPMEESMEADPMADEMGMNAGMTSSPLEMTREGAKSKIV
jgi:hypothetical protein